MAGPGRRESDCECIDSCECSSDEPVVVQTKQTTCTCPDEAEICPMTSNTCLESSSCSCPEESEGLSDVSSCPCLRITESCYCTQPFGWIQESSSASVSAPVSPGYTVPLIPSEFDLAKFTNSDALINLQELMRDSSYMFELEKMVAEVKTECDRKKEEERLMMERMNPRDQAKHYLATNKIPQLFESLIAALMVVMPEDPVAYIEERMEEIRMVGLDKVNWEAFIYHLHPYRHPIRLQLIRDGSKYDKEYTENLRRAQEQLAEEAKQAQQRAKEEEEARRKEMEASILSGDTLADLHSSATDGEYDPDVFQLTETKD